ncbi:Hypothetical protein SMAX5B_005003 [Scophthalmus maximus]|uniref:Uncharacterized protein n=1 Tax=Scophthalmus maximus TaxID=52904 RepID=A0A2U9AZL2_SCOMX|nr:Hypothetical protein SMAX5B_005003 [Scophthalmus maximus]
MSTEPLGPEEMGTDKHQPSYNELWSDIAPRRNRCQHTAILFTLSACLVPDESYSVSAGTGISIPPEVQLLRLCHVRCCNSRANTPPSSSPPSQYISSLAMLITTLQTLTHVDSCRCHFNIFRLNNSIKANSCKLSDPDSCKTAAAAGEAQRATPLTLVQKVGVRFQVT